MSGMNAVVLERLRDCFSTTQAYGSLPSELGWLLVHEKLAIPLEAPGCTGVGGSVRMRLQIDGGNAVQSLG